MNNVHIENRSLYSKVDIHTFTPTDPSITPNTRLTGKVVVFSGELDMLPEDACQLAVDTGAGLKSHELISSGEGKITIIDEAEFLALAAPL